MTTLEVIEELARVDQLLDEISKTSDGQVAGAACDVATNLNCLRNLLTMQAGREAVDEYLRRPRLAS